MRLPILRSRLARDICAIFCLKLIGLAVLWFFFVHGHVAAHGSKETDRHFLSILRSAASSASLGKNDARP